MLVEVTLKISSFPNANQKEICEMLLFHRQLHAATINFSVVSAIINKKQKLREKRKLHIW